MEEIGLDADASRRVGALASATSGVDVVDGHIALITEERDAIVLTSDPDDLAKWGIARERMVRC